MYVLLAIPLKSYIQPLIVMVVIPFGLVGAIGGHLLIGIFPQHHEHVRYRRPRRSRRE